MLLDGSTNTITLPLNKECTNVSGSCGASNREIVNWSIKECYPDKNRKTYYTAVFNCTFSIKINDFIIF